MILYRILDSGKLSTKPGTVIRRKDRVYKSMNELKDASFLSKTQLYHKLRKGDEIMTAESTE